MDNKDKWIDMSGLPRHKCKRLKGQINWKDSINYNLKGVYYGTSFEVEIVDYGRDKRETVIIKYNNKEYEITTSSLFKCQLGRVLGERTIMFKVAIGQIFKDNKRNIIITDREYRKDKNGRKYKYYKYTCNDCGWTEGWICENNLYAGYGCGCCKGAVTVYGINSIVDTHPKLVRYFKNPEEAKKYSRCSNQKVICVCPDCKQENSINVGKLTCRGFRCKYCSDGKKYPEKFMISVLKKLGLNFKTEYSPNWDKLNKRRYDFYFKYNEEEYIIETHGIQHYEKGFSTVGGRTLEEEQANDELKKQIALNNGIKEENYIVIDCRYSELDFIRENIYSSKLSKIFNLQNIDWIEIGEVACKNLIKEVCNLWDGSDKELTTRDIENMTGLSKPTVLNYLKEGTKLGWCNYDSREEQKKRC